MSSASERARTRTDRIGTLRRAALDFLACAGLASPLALVWPAYAPLILVAGFVVALTVVVPLEPPAASEYRRYGSFVRFAGSIVFGLALAVSIVAQEPAARALDAVAGTGITPSVVRGILAACVLLAGISAAYEYRLGR